MNISFSRTNSLNKDFRLLVLQLDQYLEIINGDAHDFFNQYNQIESLNHTIVAYIKGEPVGCGGLKFIDENTVEIKRMFVPHAMRGKGIAKSVLKELETWAKELGHSRCILETSCEMKDAVGLYTACNYKPIDKYGQYKDVETSVCFEKLL